MIYIILYYRVSLEYTKKRQDSKSKLPQVLWTTHQLKTDMFPETSSFFLDDSTILPVKTGLISSPHL